VKWNWIFKCKIKKAYLLLYESTSLSIFRTHHLKTPLLLKTNTYVHRRY
jgi:hypothetical protein